MPDHGLMTLMSGAVESPAEEAMEVQCPHCGHAFVPSEMMAEEAAENEPLLDGHGDRLNEKLASANDEDDTAAKSRRFHDALKNRSK